MTPSKLMFPTKRFKNECPQHNQNVVSEMITWSQNECIHSGVWHIRKLTNQGPWDWQISGMGLVMSVLRGLSQVEGAPPFNKRPTINMWQCTWLSSNYGSHGKRTILKLTLNGLSELSKTVTQEKCPQNSSQKYVQRNVSKEICSKKDVERNMSKEIRSKKYVQRLTEKYSQKHSKFFNISDCKFSLVANK